MLSKQTAIGSIAGAVLLLSVIFIVRQCRGPYASAAPSRDWFYDLNTKKLFAAPAGSIPPIVAHSGPLPDGSPAGVKAHVFGCGGCSEARRYIGYLETYAPADKLKMEEQQRQLTQGTSDGRPPRITMDAELAMGRASLVRRIDDTDWVEIGSRAGQTIVNEAQKHCGAGLYPQVCYPKN